MPSTTETRSSVPTTFARAIITRIAGKFQVTVPVEIRDLFELQEGDLLEWNFNHETSALTLLPKRAQLITPRIREEVRELRAQRVRNSEVATVP
jgi:AbrB family looped-hinge helix DNA binding protein